MIKKYNTNDQVYNQSDNQSVNVHFRPLPRVSCMLFIYTPHVVYTQCCITHIYCDDSWVSMFMGHWWLPWIASLRSHPRSSHAIRVIVCVTPNIGLGYTTLENQLNHTRTWLLDRVSPKYICCNDLQISMTLFPQFCMNLIEAVLPLMLG